MNEDRPILSAAICRPMTLSSRNIREFVGAGRPTTVGLSMTAIVGDFDGYFVGNVAVVEP